jgi:hypothetical protein
MIGFNITSHLRLSVLSVPFHEGFLPTPPLCVPFLSYPCYMICPHYILGLIILIIFVEEQHLWRSSLRNFLSPPIISCLFDTSILLSTLLPHSLCLCNSLIVGDRIPLPYTTADNYNFLFDSFSFSLTNWMVSTVIRIYVSLRKLHDKTTYFITFNITLAFTSSYLFCRSPAN